MDELLTELEKIATLPPEKWLKVKKYGGTTLEELEKHHQEETTWLIEKCRELARKLQEEQLHRPFYLTEEQHKKYGEWRPKQEEIALEKQRQKILDLKQSSKPEDLLQASLLERMIQDGTPYYGAIGGQITFSFTPTSLGEICVVKHAGSGNELNLTDFDSW